ncbi:hypothetical protein GALL_476470 [mine drainage metagenome]|uniref:MmeI-like target recognition domain-containing protein n=1 Tax=mine drainage metagenome TaxID=410659 RepID=A0A1J5PZQ6_9ZZZZ
MTRRSSGKWIIDFGNDLTEDNAAQYETPFTFVSKIVKTKRIGNHEASADRYWWLHQRPRPDMRTALAGLPRYIATPRVAKYRNFVWQHPTVLTDSAGVAITRADDTTFGILHSRFHELWSLRMCTWLGVGNDPRYTPTTCFETFPFPAGLTPADTAHQRTETLSDGAVIPADLYKQNSLQHLAEQAHTATQNIAPKPANLRNHAVAIAQAAKRLNDLRENWLNPPEWTHKVPEVIPLGLDKSPYPERIEPKPGIGAQGLKALKKRTLTNLYNAKPAWLSLAHQELDLAVAAAYGWTDYTQALPDDEILKRLLALNLDCVV